MSSDIVILIAEDDKGHFELIKRNLWLSCTDNDILLFKNGQELLDFLAEVCKKKQNPENRYVVLLDIRMPKVDGIEVLYRMKADDELKKIPVIMVTTTSEPGEIDRCYDLGCSFYMVKPLDYRDFMEAVENLGKFLSLDGIRLP